MAIRRSYLIRIREVQQFALRYYEKGRHDKCFKQVWKKYVFPRFGINYNTFLRYMKTDVDKLLGQAEKQKKASVSLNILHGLTMGMTGQQKNRR